MQQGGHALFLVSPTKFLKENFPSFFMSMSTKAPYAGLFTSALNEDLFWLNKNTRSYRQDKKVKKGFDLNHNKQMDIVNLQVVASISIDPTPLTINKSFNIIKILSTIYKPVVLW